MNNRTINILIQGIFLYFLQILVFNHIEIGPYIKLYPYIAFVLLYPLTENRFGLFISSFVFGLLIDISAGTGGINAMSMTLCAYLRLPILKFVLGNNDIDYNNFHLRQIPLDKGLSFIFLMTLIFCLMLYSMSYFSTEYIGSIILKSLLSTFATFFILILGIFTFTKPR